MDSHQNSMYKIMQAALSLFSRFGYKKTGVRQIADASGVSLGLIHHYFTSKRLLAQQTMMMLLDYVLQETKGVVNLEQDPSLFDAVLTRAQSQYFLNGVYRQFYLDTLEEGIYFDSIMVYPFEILENLRRLYHFTDNDDYILLYTRYQPCDLEKTLVLGKEVGNFPSIPYEEIPFLICRAAKERFVPMEEIYQADQASRKIASSVLAQLSSTLPETFVQRYVCGLAEAKTASR